MSIEYIIYFSVVVLWHLIHVVNVDCVLEVNNMFLMPAIACLLSKCVLSYCNLVRISCALCL